MSARSVALAASIALLLPSAGLAHHPPYYAPGCLCDPVVTHTNGMRLASSEAHRSHNVYWQCDEGHIGYCSGRYYCPCWNDWRSLGTRHWGRFAPPPTPSGPTSPVTAHSHDGMEEASGELLGTLELDPFASSENPLQPAGSGAAGLAAFGDALGSTLGSEEPAESQPQGANWVDALNTIGRQMLATPAP